MELGFLQETKSILKSLVLSSPNGMTIDHLNRDYKEVVGNWIPFQKLGFASLEHFLKSVPDTLVVTGHGREAKVGFVTNDKLKHMDKMVSQQKNTSKERKKTVLHNYSKINETTKKSNQQISNYTLDSISQVRNKGCVFAYPTGINCSDPFFEAQKIPMIANYQIGLPTLYNIACRNPASSFHIPVAYPSYGKSNKFDYSNKIGSNNFNIKQDKKNVQDKKGDSKNENSKTNFENVFDQPHKLVNTDVKPNYSKYTAMPRDSKSMVHKNISKNNVNNPESDKLNYCHEEKQQQLEHVSVAQIDSGEHRSSRDKCQKNDLISKTDPHSSFNRLKDTNMQHETSKDFRVNDTCQTVVKSADGTFISKSNNMLPSTDTFAQIIADDDDIDEAVPEFAANNLVFRVDFPENTVAFGKKIPNYELPRELMKGSVVGVFISEIHSPFKFWFHLYKDNHELDVLMNRIECFYRRLHSSDLSIPTSSLAPGQVCAALYHNLWHRAEILSNISNDKVKVHFVDYGTISEIEKHNIKYLPTIFSSTPVQAIRGSLSHIKPISPLWPKRAIREFLSMVSDVLLYAQIVEIDEKEKTVYMVLCDTNCGKAIQINSQLVDKGFAKLDIEWDENRISKNGYRKRHPRDIFPTFEMLETGEYPSLYELEQLLAQGIDYEKMTNKLIFSDICKEFVVQGDSRTRKNTLSFSLLDTNPFKRDIISEIISLKIFGK